jgi:phosphatidylglycerophosphate synthase
MDPLADKLLVSSAMIWLVALKSDFRRGSAFIIIAREFSSAGSG